MGFDQEQPSRITAGTADILHECVNGAHAQCPAAHILKFDLTEVVRRQTVEGRVKTHRDPFGAAGRIESGDAILLPLFDEFRRFTGTGKPLLCLLISAVAVYSGWYGLWFGGFIAYGIRLIIHIGQSIVIRKYIPALATSLLTLPLSVYFII